MASSEPKSLWECLKTLPSTRRGRARTCGSRLIRCVHGVGFAVRKDHYASLDERAGRRWRHRDLRLGEQRSEADAEAEAEAETEAEVLLMFAESGWAVAVDGSAECECSQKTTAAAGLNAGMD